TSTTAAMPPSARRTYRPPASRMRDCASVATTPAMAKPAVPPRRRSFPALAGALHQRGRAVAFEDVDQQHLAAVRLDGFVADDLLAGVVAALDQHARPDLLDQADRRVFLKDHDEVDRFQRRQHFGPRALFLHRAPLAFQPAYRSVAVQPDHQPVAGA